MLYQRLIFPNAPQKTNNKRKWAYLNGPNLRRSSDSKRLSFGGFILVAHTGGRPKDGPLSTVVRCNSNIENVGEIDRDVSAEYHAGHNRFRDIPRNRALQLLVRYITPWTRAKSTNKKFLSLWLLNVIRIFSVYKIHYHNKYKYVKAVFLSRFSNHHYYRSQHES